jgi:hypothetical protein
MMNIAAMLNARVQGDDGEFYDENYFKSNEVIPNIIKPTNKKLWWKFWQLLNNISTISVAGN